MQTHTVLLAARRPGAAGIVGELRPRLDIEKGAKHVYTIKPARLQREADTDSSMQDHELSCDIGCKPTTPMVHNAITHAAHLLAAAPTGRWLPCRQPRRCPGSPRETAHLSVPPCTACAKHYFSPSTSAHHEGVWKLSRHEDEPCCNSPVARDDALKLRGRSWAPGPQRANTNMLAKLRRADGDRVSKLP